MKVFVGGFILMGVTRQTLDTVVGHWKVVNQVDSSMGHAVGQYDWRVLVRTGLVGVGDSQRALVKGLLVRAQCGVPS